MHREPPPLWLDHPSIAAAYADPTRASEDIADLAMLIVRRPLTADEWLFLRTSMNAVDTWRARSHYDAPA